VKKQKPFCPHCGSDNVISDAAAVWDVHTQSWRFVCSYKGKTCADCGECDLILRWEEA